MNLSKLYQFRLTLSHRNSWRWIAITCLTLDYHWYKFQLHAEWKLSFPTLITPKTLRIALIYLTHLINYLGLVYRLF